MNKLTRRKIIVAAVTLMSIRLRRVFGGMQNDGRAVEELVGILRRNRSSAIAVGRKCLRCMPGTANEPRLVSLISGGRSAPPLIGDGAQAVREWVCMMSRADFREGRVVEVDGWILSATEARLCALSALS